MHCYPRHFKFTRLSLLLATLMVGLCIGNPVLGQNPLPVQLNSQEKVEPEEKEEEVSVDEWIKGAQERLKEVTARIKELEKDEEQEPTAKQKQQQELLSWLELTLSQLQDEQKKAEQLDEYLKTEQEELDKFLQQGLSSEDPASFLDLDNTRDELAAEQKRLKRVKNRVEAATESLETARKEQKERASARRLALEAVERNSDDDKRQALGDELAEAQLFCEIAEATAQLRQQELENSKTNLEAQQAQVKTLKERAARLGTVAQFGIEQLEELLAELEQQESVLESEINRSEEAENEVTILEGLWLRAQQKIDASQGDKQVLQQEVEGYKVRSRALRERTRLLRQQLERISDYPEIWQRRQQAFLGSPTRANVRKWTEQTEESLEELEGEQAATSLDIEDLQSELKRSKEALEEAESNSEAASALDRQIAGYESLLESHRQDMESIRESISLHEKLLDELDAGSLTATAKDTLSDAWEGVQGIWNLELTNFGENPLTVRKVVMAVLLLLIGLMVSRSISRFLGAQVLRRIDIDPSASASIQSLFFYTLLLIFTLFSLKVVNVPLTAFTVLGGAVALGVGFGSQNIINNFISGLILHAERPVKVGDLIQLDDLYGNVEHIGARSTRVRTGSNLEIIVPNSAFLQNNVINFTLSSDKVRTSVEVGVIYGSPVVTVTQLLRQAVLETGRVSKDPPPIILFKNFGDNSLVFEIHFWIRMRTVMDRLQVESAVRYRIEQLFTQDGIVIAFPQRDVHLDTASPLQVQMLPVGNDEVPNP